jgi:hypothetical protein
MKRAVVLALMAIPSPGLAQRVELPVREVDLPNGDRRFAVSLTIDGQTQDVGIDTGSTGLRVLPRGLGPAGRTAKGARVSYSYGSGTAFEGEAVSLPVAAGVVAGTIKVMRIDAVGCVQQRPDCPASRVAPAQFGIQGDGIAGQGFTAILGIRLQRDAVANPFEQLGVHRWLVELPTNLAAPGRIVLNPSDEEAAGYAKLDVDGEGTTAGCLNGPQQICGRALFDTGAAGLRVIRAEPFRPWPNGTRASLAVGEGAQRQSFDLRIGRRDQASALAYTPGPRETRLSFGFAPYYHWSVLYDADRHQIGLKAR